MLSVRMQWHLGIGVDGEHLPTRAGGFDSYFGMPVTNVQSCMPGKTIYGPGMVTGTLLEFFLIKMGPMLLPGALAAAACIVAVLLLQAIAGDASPPSLLATAVWLGKPAGLLLAASLVLAYVYMSEFTLISSRACLLYRPRSQALVWLRCRLAASK